MRKVAREPEVVLTGKMEMDGFNKLMQQEGDAA